MIANLNDYRLFNKSVLDMLIKLIVESGRSKPTNRVVREATVLTFRRK